MYSFQAFSLTIHSDIPFPELLPCAYHEQPAHDVVTIKLGEVNPNGLGAYCQSKSLFYQATQTELWLHIPNVARFLISNGNQIIVDQLNEADLDSVRVFILGSCMGALLIQRDLFILHGNAIKVGNHCISVVGHSGVGKSTLSGAFYKRGYSILADDICAVNAEGQVLPSFPQIKLWFDAAKHLMIDTTGLRKIRPLIEKFAIPLAQQFHPEALPLKVVYVLRSHNKDEFTMSNMEGMHKLKPLQNNIFRKNYVEIFGKERCYFIHSARIANQISVIPITRPTDGFRLNELVDLIENDLTERGYLYATA